MKGPLFVDTAYLLALVNTRDRYHAVAQRLAAEAQPPFVTSEAILLEVGNALAPPPRRALGAALLERLTDDPDFEIVPLTPKITAAAIALYRKRPDKGWGLTDCTSLVIMRQRDIRRALAMDRRFEQEGFVAVMKQLT